MSWPDRPSRRAALLGLLVLPAACGLTPVYGPGGAGTRLFGKVRPRDPQTFQDFSFNQRLAERLGPDGAAIYDLDYRLSVGVVPQAITPDEVTTRYSLNGTADFALTDASGGVLAQGRVSSFTSYSTTGTTIATLAAEGDARERLARMLADQVVTRLLAAATSLPDTQPVRPTE
ncbi:LPS assembly lipoprotein LptE [Paracoccus sp. YLB-12]|jgi:LPS-assembly lipoprotein|uniref:LPS assembly lipoprotein LptE n=1 Tax=Paracoccus maritimus TaxID=2933292 RepID=A0ABT2K4U5_9RHOB|nr:LPS assembly lipoprotein LptE [Paracoccus sp. YLB-12]MCT4331386.1 LPS assembly lipoprotein LptE [Paracoccus sp. YLB-12]